MDIKTKRQHYVPQFYLRYFTDQANFLYGFKRKKTNFSNAILKMFDMKNICMKPIGKMPTQNSGNIYYPIKLKTHFHAMKLNTVQF